MTVEWSELLAHVGVLAIVVVVLWWASRAQVVRDEIDYRRSVLPFDDDGD